MATLSLTTAATIGGAAGYFTDPMMPPDRVGCEFQFDLGSALGFPAQENPAGSAVITNLGGGDAGLVVKASTDTITYAGGGFNWAAITADNYVVRGPTNALANIFAGAQEFMVWFWAKLPSEADWNDNASILPFFETSGNANGYTATADMLTIAQAVEGTTRYLSARRQTNGSSTADKLNLSPTDHYGQIAQIAYWRDSTGQALQMRSAAGVKRATSAKGSDNTGDFSGKGPRWGVPDAFTNLGNSDHPDAIDWTLYRGGIEDLEASGRDALSVLNADWHRTIGRGVYS